MAKKKRPARNIRVRMLRDLDFSPDGINIRRFEAGGSYSLPKAQADRYLKKGLAEEDKAVDKVPETKGGKHGGRSQKRR